METSITLSHLLAHSDRVSFITTGLVSKKGRCSDLESIWLDKNMSSAGWVICFILFFATFCKRKDIWKLFSLSEFRNLDASIKLAPQKMQSLLWNWKKKVVYCQQCSDVWSKVKTGVTFKPSSFLLVNQNLCDQKLLLKISFEK